MSIREKLRDFKRRLSDRKMYSIVLVVIGAVAIWGIVQYKHSADLRQELDNQYNRAFYDMIGYVNNVETLLMKSLVTGSPTSTASNLQEAWRQANLAQTNLGQLPIAQQTLANTSKFLTQVGDLSYSLNVQNMDGTTLDDKEYKTLEKLHGFSVTLGKSLSDLQNQLSTGRMKWGELARKGTPLFQKTSSKVSMKQLENIDKTFQEYPTLIYDGPFSDHITTMKPVGVTGEQMSAEEVKKKVSEFFGKDKVKEIKFTGKNEETSIKTYSYQVTFKDGKKGQDANIDMTQKGGHPLWMLNNRPVPSEEINMDEAKKKAKKYLEDHGFKDLIDTYYLKEDNTATLNFAYKQGNTVVYPDLIKVKIALDNGEIVGIESKGYLFSHRKREIPNPAISEEEARKKINKRVEIKSVGLAIIPTEFKSEIFVYEFKGKLDKSDFIVYINAKTGKEENILMIIDTPNGTLTM